MYGLLTNPWVILSLLVALLGTHGFVYYKGWDSRDNKAKIELAKEVQARVAALEAYDKVSREYVKKLQVAQAETKVVYRTIKERVKDETTGRVCFDDKSVRLWNDALQGNVSETSTRATEETSRTYSDEVVLNNAVQNLEQYKECRDQLNSLITWHEEN